MESHSLELFGTWELQSFEIDDGQNRVRPWGRNARGLLIYASTGHVSVSILRDAQGNSPQDILDSILFYAGTFTVRENAIHHQVTVASSPQRVGREMIRYAKVDGDRLTLTTPQEAFGRAILVWRRVKE